MTKKEPIRPKQVHGDRYYRYDGCFEVEESEHQYLHLHFGPVFHGDEIQSVKGLWIDYQTNYGQKKATKNDLHGPLLLSPKTAKALAEWLLRKVEEIK